MPRGYGSGGGGGGGSVRAKSAMARSSGVWIASLRRRAARTGGVGRVRPFGRVQGLHGADAPPTEFQVSVAGGVCCCRQRVVGAFGPPWTDGRRLPRPDMHRQVAGTSARHGPTVVGVLRRHGPTGRWRLGLGIGTESTPTPLAGCERGGRRSWRRRVGSGWLAGWRAGGRAGGNPYRQADGGQLTRPRPPRSPATRHATPPATVGQPPRPDAPPGPPLPGPPPRPSAPPEAPHPRSRR